MTHENLVLLIDADELFDAMNANQVHIKRYKDRNDKLHDQITLYVNVIYPDEKDHFKTHSVTVRTNDDSEGKAAILRYSTGTAKWFGHGYPSKFQPNKSYKFNRDE